MKRFSVSIVVVAAVMGTLAANASAHLWLTLSGADVTSTLPATSEGLLLFKIAEISPLLGGGEIVIHCDFRLVGTVGASGTDEVTSIENLSGTEKVKID